MLPEDSFSYRLVRASYDCTIPNAAVGALSSTNKLHHLHGTANTLYSPSTILSTSGHITTGRYAEVLKWAGERHSHEPKRVRSFEISIQIRRRFTGLLRSYAEGSALDTLTGVLYELLGVQHDLLPAAFGWQSPPASVHHSKLQPNLNMIFLWIMIDKERLLCPILRVRLLYEQRKEHRNRLYKPR